MSNGPHLTPLRALVRDKQIASDSAGLPECREPSIHNCSPFYAFPIPGTQRRRSSTAIHAEIERLKKEDVSDEELKMIKTRGQSQFDPVAGSNEGFGVRARLESGTL